MTVPGSGDGKIVLNLEVKYDESRSKQAFERAVRDGRILKQEQRAINLELQTLDRQLSLQNKSGKSLAISYQERVRAAQKATNEIIKEERKLLAEQKRVEKEAVAAAKKAPREQADVLRAAGMSDEGIKAVQVELKRAGGSVSSMTKALERMNVPASRARAIAIAMKEAANEAHAMQGELNEAFFKWRRISEQGVRLSEIGFILGAGGAAILAPLTLAATQYVERFRSLEDEAARFTAIQNEQKEVISELGREASVALVPVMEQLLDILKEITRVIKENPGLLQGIVGGGAALTAVGAAMVLFGRIESVFGRFMALFATRMPGSIPIPGLTQLTAGPTQEGIGLTALGAGVAKVGIFAGAITAGTLLGGALLRVAQNLGILNDAFDTTGDGVVDFHDSIKNLRAALMIAIISAVDGFFRVATAIANFISIVGELPERIKNWVGGQGFVTDTQLAKRDELMGQRETLINKIQEAQAATLGSLEPTEALEERRDAIRQSIADKEAVIASNERLMEGAGVELRDSLGAMNDTLREEIRTLSNTEKGLSDEIAGRLTGTGLSPEEQAANLQNLTEQLKALDEAIAGVGGAWSPAGQEIEAERVRVLAAMGPGAAEFVKTGTIGGGGGGGGTAFGTGPTDEPTRPIGPTPEELALFGAFRQAEMQAERQFNQQLADLARQRRLQELQAEREYLRNREQMLREQARQERDMLEDHALDTQQAQIEFARKEADIERKRQFDRLQKLREHELKLTELAAARDVAGFVEAQKRFALEQRQEEKQADFDKKQRQREFDIERADKEREFQHQLAQQRRANQEQLDDAKRAYEVQKDERLRQYNEQLQQMRTEQDRQRQERLRDFAQQLDDLKVSQGTLTEERRAYNEEIRKGYSELLAAHGEELKRALQQVYGLSGARTSTPNYLPPVPQNNRSVTIPSSTLRLTRFKVGSRNVPRDMIAHLDAGERVLTARQNQMYGPMLDQLDRGRTWPTSNRITNVYITGNAIGRIPMMEDLHELGMALVQGLEDSGAML